MGTESESFQPADIDGFLDEFVLVERDHLAERLTAAGARLQELAPRIPNGAAPGSHSRGAGGGKGSARPARGGRSPHWSAHEVLAHIAALSKLYGMLTYRIGSGALTEFELMPMVNQRDSAGAALAQLPASELAAMIQADHRRTLEYVRRAGPDDLRRTCALGQGREMSAGEVLRLALVAHLEQHVRQLEAALPGS